MQKKSFQATTPAWQKITLVFLGLLLSLVLLEAGLRLGGFVLSSIQGYRNLQSMKQKGVYRILCIGESTTQGEYPHLLEQVLNQRNIGVRFSVIDKGRGGRTTDTLLEEIESNLTEYHPDMVVAMMGINDAMIGIHGGGSAMLTTSGRMPFIRSLKIYFLARLLWLHWQAKAKEMGFYQPDADRQSPGKAQAPVPKIELKETSAKSVSAEDLAKRAIMLDPKNDKAYFNLGQIYAYKDEFLRAEDYFKKAIAINPESYMAYFDLGTLYRFQGQLLPKAEEAFKKSFDLATEKGDARALGAMATLLEEMDKSELAKEYAAKAQRVRFWEYLSAAVDNYHKLKKILDKRRVRLVCVQYPIRNIGPLKKIFGKNEGVIFVDNESVFKEALKKGGYKYKEYFKDMFAGDFGHCTQKGNELLAQNIADVILREVFHQ